MIPMRGAQVRLWPFGLGAALVAVPAIWAVCAGTFYFTSLYLGWPGHDLGVALTYFSLGISVVPLLLLLLDFIAARGGVVGNKWLTVDFSKAIAEGGIASRDTFALPDNILAEQDRLADSDGTKMIEAMKRATTSEIVYLDLKDGNAWWVTRLLAFCAGAQGIGSPRAIVFVGRKENRERVFLGWGTPAALLAAILNASPEYRLRFHRAKMITRQLAMFGPWNSSLMLQLQPRQPATPPPQPQSISLHQDVANNQAYYDDNDSVMLAKISIEELRRTGDTAAVPGVSMANLEDPPDRLTLVRLQDLFAPCLYLQAVDKTWPNAEQLERFLASTAPYVALVRDGVYEGMLRADLGERAVIRELFRQSQEKSAKSSGV
jgi:hypothetical protein